MRTAEQYRSGATAASENFPVASALIARRHRAPVVAYYRFARAADDVADHPSLSEPEKFALLDQLEATLLGKTDADPAALPLRTQLALRGLGAEHALDLLLAFRADVTKRRYRDWGELMHYCRYSAAPVGRFVLEVHGESRDSWAANDALCAALQVINHMQDCARDYQALDRVYLPLDCFKASGAEVETLGQRKASPELLGCLAAVQARTAALLPEAAQLPYKVRNLRLAAETSVIVALAQTMLAHLVGRDPLSQRVRLNKTQAASAAARGAAAAVLIALRRTLGTTGACRMAVMASHGAAPSAGTVVVASSSFYLAMRILPREQRTAMFEVYGFCRGVDDAADAPAPHAERMDLLAAWRGELESLYAGHAPGTRLAGLAGPVKRFALAKEDFEAIIDGMVMDAREDIRAPDWATLDLYCDRVASAVGRLAVRIFGVPASLGPPLAHHLGRALQLTNILRDLDEDATLGRLYLPREALAEAGVAATEPHAVIAHPDVATACAVLVRRARGHFADAVAVMDACPRTTVRSPRLMARVYATLLDELVERGFAAPRARVRIPKHRVAWAVVRSALA